MSAPFPTVEAGKAAVRRALLERRRGLDPVWAAAASERIRARIADADAFRRAACVGAYLALAREVQTRGVIDDARAAGKAVMVPALDRAAGLYRWAWLRPGAALAEGPLHVAEPAEPDWVAGERADLVLVPGVAFDRAGGRLGRGGGWYDRLLVASPMAGAWRIGVAFEFQVLDRVPMEPHDARMDEVVTESGASPAGRPENGETNATRRRGAGGKKVTV